MPDGTADEVQGGSEIKPTPERDEDRGLQEQIRALKAEQDNLQ